MTPTARSEHQNYQARGTERMTSPPHFSQAVGHVIDLATRNKDADFHERFASGALLVVVFALMSAGFWFAAPRYNALAASCAGPAAILQFAVLSMPVCRAFA